MKVLFLSVPTGQGHHQTAKAVLEYFKNDDSVTCEFLDVVDNTSPFLAEHLQKGYLFSTTMAPRVYGTFYDMADKRDASKASYLGKLVKSLLNKKLYEYIKNYDPDVIVATHLISAMAFTYLKKKHEIRAKAVAIVTDFTFHPFWEDTKMDYYITASDAKIQVTICKHAKKHTIICSVADNRVARCRRSGGRSQHSSSLLKIQRARRSR